MFKRVSQIALKCRANCIKHYYTFRKFIILEFETKQHIRREVLSLIAITSRRILIIPESVISLNK